MIWTTCVPKTSSGAGFGFRRQDSLFSRTKFPFPSKKFPVLLSREVCCKPLNLHAYRLSKSHQASGFEKFPVLFPVSRDLVETGSTATASATTHSARTGHFPDADELSRASGGLLSSPAPDLRCGDPVGPTALLFRPRSLGRSVSGHGIPFPGNGDRLGRLVRMWRLRRGGRACVLAGPFGGQFAEPATPMPCGRRPSIAALTSRGEESQ